MQSRRISRLHPSRSSHLPACHLSLAPISYQPTTCARVISHLPVFSSSTLLHLLPSVGSNPRFSSSSLKMQLSERPATTPLPTMPPLAIDPSKFPNLPTRKALLLIDIQNDFLADDGALPITSDDRAKFVDRISRLADAFRATGDVIWVTSQLEKPRKFEEGQDIIASSLGSNLSSNRGRPSLLERFQTLSLSVDEEAFLSQTEPVCVRPGTSGIEPPECIKKNIADHPKDMSIAKTNYSAFKDTALLSMLRRKLVTKLYLCGSLMNIGVHATAADAAMHGHSITILSDCCGWRQEMRRDKAIKNLTEVSGCEIMTYNQFVESLTHKARAPTSLPAAPRALAPSNPAPRTSSTAKKPAPVSSKDASRTNTRSLVDALRNLDLSRSRGTERGLPPLGDTPELEADSKAVDEPTIEPAAELKAERDLGLEAESGPNSDSKPEVSSLSTTVSKPGKTATKPPSPGPDASAEKITADESGAGDQNNDLPATGSAVTESEKSGEKKKKARKRKKKSKNKGNAGEDNKQKDEKMTEEKGEEKASNSEAALEAEKVLPALSGISSVAEPDSSSPDSRRILPGCTKKSGTQETDKIVNPPASSVETNSKAPPHKRRGSTGSDSGASALSSSSVPPHSKESAPLCEGDTKIIYHVLPPELETGVFETLRNEVKWGRMPHHGGEVPRLIAVQGDVKKDGSIPVYRHPADSSPKLASFSPTVEKIRVEVEKHLGHPVNHVLIQLYRNGHDYISEHSDKTIDVVRGSYIANLSLGAERTMVFRTKRPSKERVQSTARAPETTERTSTESTKSKDPSPASAPRHAERSRLPHNSLCRMGLATNMRWLHSIRQDKRRTEEKDDAELAFGGERISLTFRNIGTFLNGNEKRIWGQGATAKTQKDAKPVINGTTQEATDLLLAFGAENQQTEFDWDKYYGRGFDVLHMSDAKTEASD